MTTGTIRHTRHGGDFSDINAAIAAIAALMSEKSPPWRVCRIVPVVICLHRAQLSAVHACQPPAQGRAFLHGVEATSLSGGREGDGVVARLVDRDGAGHDAVAHEGLAVERELLADERWGGESAGFGSGGGAGA